MRIVAVVLSVLSSVAFGLGILWYGFAGFLWASIFLAVGVAAECAHQSIRRRV